MALISTLAACSGAAGTTDDSSAASSAPSPARTVASTPTTSTTAPAPPRRVHEQTWVPFAAVGPLRLRHPSSRVERVAFHQANHDGARTMAPLPEAAEAVDLESRERDTAPRTAADVVVDPQVEIRAPVSGRVKRAGTYILYCDHADDFAVIEPDERPGWEVKILHIDGVLVRAGQRVVAGVTVLAPRPTPLPFESQVDELTADPRWPHVHVEVVDPSIPDRPSGPGC